MLKSQNVTHILSVLGRPFDDALFNGYKHKVIEADDVDDENLLQHFPECNRFIQRCLDDGEGILVHW